MAAKSPLSPSATASAACVGSVTINAAFFRDVKEAHVEVRAMMEQILRLGPDSYGTNSSCQKLTEQFEELVELVSLYFSLEESYGYFEDPVFVGAEYSQQVSELRGEHSSLRSELARLSDHASRLLYNGRLQDSVDAILARFRVFCDQFEQHEVRERELITDAFSVDLGCGD